MNPNTKPKVAAPVPPTPLAAAPQAAPLRKSDDAPVLLVRWYEVVKWLLERVESFPKNQRFIFGQRVADAALDIMDLLVEAAYRKEKREVLVRANLRLERLRRCFSGSGRERLKRPGGGLGCVFLGCARDLSVRLK